MRWRTRSRSWRFSTEPPKRWERGSRNSRKLQRTLFCATIAKTYHGLASWEKAEWISPAPLVERWRERDPGSAEKLYLRIMLILRAHSSSPRPTGRRGLGDG